eukprot:205997-Prymnesium_polylepis.1
MRSCSADMDAPPPRAAACGAHAPSLEPSSGAAHGDGVFAGCGRDNKEKVAAEGVEGAWFQSSSAPGATATRGDGCGQRMVPNWGASNDATGGAAVDALGGAARGEARQCRGWHGPYSALRCSGVCRGCCG